MAITLSQDERVILQDAIGGELNKRGRQVVDFVIDICLGNIDGNKLVLELLGTTKNVALANKDALEAQKLAQENNLDRVVSTVDGLLNAIAKGVDAAVAAMAVNS